MDAGSSPPPPPALRLRQRFSLQVAGVGITHRHDGLKNASVDAVIVPQRRVDDALRAALLVLDRVDPFLLARLQVGEQRLDRGVGPFGVTIKQAAADELQAAGREGGSCPEAHDVLVVGYAEADGHVREQQLVYIWWRLLQQIAISRLPGEV